jgi:hypothetical protein
MEQGFLITKMTNGSNDTPARSAQPGRANKNIWGLFVLFEPFGSFVINAFC